MPDNVVSWSTSDLKVYLLVDVMPQGLAFLLEVVFADDAIIYRWFKRDSSQRQPPADSKGLGTLTPSTVGGAASNADTGRLLT